MRRETKRQKNPTNTSSSSSFSGRHKIHGSCIALVVEKYQQVPYMVFQISYVLSCAGRKMWKAFSAPEPFFAGTPCLPRVRQNKMNCSSASLCCSIGRNSAETLFLASWAGSSNVVHLMCATQICTNSRKLDPFEILLFLLLRKVEQKTALTPTKVNFSLNCHSGRGFGIALQFSTLTQIVHFSNAITHDELSYTLIFVS